MCVICTYCEILLTQNSCNITGVCIYNSTEQKYEKYHPVQRPLHQLARISNIMCTVCSAVVQARTKGLLWKTKVLDKKTATQLNLSGPQQNHH